MQQIGVRELKQSLSKILRAVGRGEQVRVTNRGRPVADIVPAGAASGDERLRALVVEGRLTPPSRSRPKTYPQTVKARRRASSLVLSEREAER